VGRRRGASGNRERILAVARRHFAQDGFDGAGLRAIAADASVDAALVLHYFGSKAALFTAAVDLPPDPDAVARISVGRVSDMGRRLAAAFVAVWEDPAQREANLAVLRAATTCPYAAQLLRERLAERLLTPIGAGLGGPDAGLRAALCASQLVGLGVSRYILNLMPLSSMPVEQVAVMVAPTLQHYLTGRVR
jgi:AcrR family transcriptional regulator